jgi:hypothetical protein
LRGGKFNLVAVDARWVGAVGRDDVTGSERDELDAAAVARRLESFARDVFPVPLPDPAEASSGLLKPDRDTFPFWLEVEPLDVLELRPFKIDAKVVFDPLVEFVFLDHGLSPFLSLTGRSSVW